jgi:hypothetical protein
MSYITICYSADFCTQNELCTQKCQFLQPWPKCEQKKLKISFFETCQNRFLSELTFSPQLSKVKNLAPPGEQFQVNAFDKYFLARYPRSSHHAILK